MTKDISKKADKVAKKLKKKTSKAVMAKIAELEIKIKNLEEQISTGSAEVGQKLKDTMVDKANKVLDIIDEKLDEPKKTPAKKTTIKKPKTPPVKNS